MSTLNLSADMSKGDPFAVKKSHHYDLDDNLITGDLGLNGYVLESVPLDTILVSLIDMDKGLKQEGNFFVAASASVKSWRKARVEMVGPYATEYSVGDLVIFPNSKGIETGELLVRRDNKEIYIENGFFLSSDRIFGKISKK